MRKQTGFSLIEIICVLVILGFLGAFATVGFSRYIRLYSSIKDVDVAIQQGQIAMNRLFLEITSIDKGATGNQFVLSDPGGVYAAPYQFASLDGTPDIDKVISWDSGAKRLSLNNSPLCDNVSNFYMQKNAAGASVSDLKFVTVSISISVGGVTKDFTSQVTLKPL